MNKRKWILKTLFGIVFNLIGAYLLFFPQLSIVVFSKIVGAIGLLFSYYVFFVNIREDFK